ncbi:nicotinate phosphoribosyltransferase [Actinopolymorpha singaporensis]
MVAGLVTDLYELNMAASYLRRGMSGPATFSLFVRALPPDRGFLVAAGLEDCLTALESFAFETEDLDWLRDAGFDDATVRGFAGLRFTGDVRAVPEGRVVLADEPLLEVTAPAAEAQLVETVLLNHITYQTAIATKAARCRLAAGDMELVDFAFRRTHGIEAGMAVARLSSIAGFAATSNVEAARRYGLPAAGTMAHSYVEAFPREIDAFRAFVEDLPGPVTFLVDTYDTLLGVRAAVRVIQDMTLDRPLAVRLDSGDLVALARETRQILDEAGLRKVRVFVSGGLDEYDLERFILERAPIDAAGVGTRMGVSADAPSLDSAYKLVAFGDRPVCKLSPGKATLPGAKQVWRHFPIEQDILALREEAGPDGFEPVLVEVMRNGRRLGSEGTIAAARERCVRDVSALPPDVRRIRGPSSPRMRVSEGLAALATRTARSAARRQDLTW